MYVWPFFSINGMTIIEASGMTKIFMKKSKKIYIGV